MGSGGRFMSRILLRWWSLCTTLSAHGSRTPRPRAVHSTLAEAQNGPVIWKTTTSKRVDKSMNATPATAHDPPKPVGIWIRVSTEDQARGESPEHHEKRARSYGKAKGWRVKEVYHLEAVSGKAVMHHPEAERMLADVREGRITGLIFSKLGRLARNTRELLELSDIFREHHADLISLQEAIDTTSPAGRLFYTMIAAMAQWEREEIAERVAASVPIRAKLGKPLGGSAPFGYQWKDKKLVPHPTEAPVRKLLCEVFLETRRKLTTARILNERGYRTRRGEKFTVSTVERLLRDPVAKGLRIMNYTTQRGKNVKLKPESEWVYVDVEPIVSGELWAQVNQIRAEQREKNKRPGRKVVHLFTGIVFCGCGGKMYVPSNSPKYICWQCRKKLPVDDLETIYREQLKEYFVSTETVAEHLKDVDSVVAKQQELLQALLAEKRKHEADIEKLYDLYFSGEIPKQGVRDQIPTTL
jgi:site-specific DNA recombinase